jgi:hypothetical protein
MAPNTTRKAFSAKASEHAKSGKNLVIEIDWTGMTLEATRDLATKDIVIRVQTKLRKKLNEYREGQVVKVKAADYTSISIDPITMLKAMSEEERIEFLVANGLLAKPEEAETTQK